MVKITLVAGNSDFHGVISTEQAMQIMQWLRESEIQQDEIDSGEEVVSDTAPISSTTGTEEEEPKTLRQRGRPAKSRVAA